MTAPQGVSRGNAYNVPVDRVIPTHVSNTDPATIEGQAARQPFEENVKDRRGLVIAGRSIDIIISVLSKRERAIKRVIEKVMIRKG